MAHPLSEPDDDLLELPPGSIGEDEEVGVDDAEELLFQELDLATEDVGLDAETGGADAFGALAIDDDDPSEDEPLEDATLPVEDDLDADEQEHGWLEDSDGSPDDGWDDSLPDDLDDEEGDDGGEEGVDDPLLDGLPEDATRARRHDDEDDAEGFEDDGLDEFARELGNDA